MSTLIVNNNQMKQKNDIDDVVNAMRKLNTLALIAYSPEATAAKIEQVIFYKLAISVRKKYFLAQKLTPSAIFEISKSLTNEFKLIYDASAIASSIVQYVGRGFKDPENSVYDINLLINSSLSIVGSCQSLYSYFDNFTYLYGRNLDIEKADGFINKSDINNDIIDALNDVVTYLEDKMIVGINIKQNQIVEQNDNNIDYDKAIIELKTFYNTILEDDEELANFILKRMIVIGFVYTIGKRKSLMNDITDNRCPIVIERLFDIYLMTMVNLGFGQNDDYKFCQSLLKSGIAQFIIDCRSTENFELKTFYPTDLLRDISFYPNAETFMIELDKYTQSFMAIASKTNHLYCVRSSEHELNNEDCNCDVF